MADLLLTVTKQAGAASPSFTVAVEETTARADGTVADSTLTVTIPDNLSRMEVIKLFDAARRALSKAFLSSTTVTGVTRGVSTLD